jgi:acyl-CoA reductase-like NAD-dependent aldehyde dehydrogenase
MAFRVTCSAASRAYVERGVAPELVRRLVAQAEGLKVGDPLARDTHLGPVVDEDAVGRYERTVAT